MKITSLWEVTYKNSPKGRKVMKTIRCAEFVSDLPVVDGEFVISIRCIGEYAGPWCPLPV